MWVLMLYKSSIRYVVLCLVFMNRLCRRLLLFIVLCSNLCWWKFMMLVCWIWCWVVLLCWFISWWLCMVIMWIGRIICLWFVVIILMLRGSLIFCFLMFLLLFCIWILLGCSRLVLIFCLLFGVNWSRLYGSCVWLVRFVCWWVILIFGFCWSRLVLLRVYCWLIKIMVIGVWLFIICLIRDCICVLCSRYSVGINSICWWKLLLFVLGVIFWFLLLGNVLCCLILLVFGMLWCVVVCLDW